MTNKTNQLDSPLTLRSGVTLPNRFGLAPLTNTQSNPDGSLHEEELSWLVRRAGHFGLISTCAAYVSEEGKAWVGQLGVAEDHHLPGLTRLAKEIKARGSVPMVQLHHAGKRASLAPQKISTSDDGGVRGASNEDIRRIINDFVQAAVRVEQAGFSGVEVHGANGYIFTQFLSPRDNPRTDEYGGDISGRAKFLRETLQAIRRQVSPSFMVNVRISPVDFRDRRGIRLDESVQLAQWLAEDGVDVIHLSLQDASGPAPFEDHHRPIARVIREATPPEVMVAAAGGIWNREDAKRAVDAGVDIAVLGKAAIVHPDWPTTSQSKTFTPARPPWEVEYLQKVAVGPNFQEYLKRNPGMVVGGAPPRL